MLANAKHVHTCTQTPRRCTCQNSKSVSSTFSVDDSRQSLSPERCLRVMYLTLKLSSNFCERNKLLSSAAVFRGQFKRQRFPALLGLVKAAARGHPTTLDRLCSAR